jgi:hypothetical protein
MPVAGRSEQQPDSNKNATKLKKKLENLQNP